MERLIFRLATSRKCVIGDGRSATVLPLLLLLMFTIKLASPGFGAQLGSLHDMIQYPWMSVGAEYSNNGHRIA
jgi:hypothetical protein